MSESKKYDMPALIKWAEEFQPSYVEKLSEIELGNKIITISGVQIPADMFCKNLVNAMRLFKKKRLSSKYKEEQAVLAAKKVTEEKAKQDAIAKEEQRRKDMEAKEAERRKIREARREERIAEKEKALQDEGLID